MILAASECLVLRGTAGPRYEQEFPSTPVMIQEYHNPHGEVEKDLVDILQLAQGALSGWSHWIWADSPLLNGVSFFEFHIRQSLGSQLQVGVKATTREAPRWTSGCSSWGCGSGFFLHGHLPGLLHQRFRLFWRRAASLVPRAGQVQGALEVFRASVGCLDGRAGTVCAGERIWWGGTGLP